MDNFGVKIKQLFENYRTASKTLAGFIEDSQKSITERVTQTEKIAIKLKRIKSGENLEVERDAGETVSIEFSEKEMAILVDLMDWRLERLGRYPHMLLNMAFIYLVAIFDAFITDIFITVLIQKPEALKSKKQITYEKILELQEKGDLITYLAHREINELSYKSIADQSDYFKAKFNIDLSESGVPLERLIEMRATRNLLIHNNGVVNMIFLEAVAQSTYSLGDRVDITLDYWRQCEQHLDSIAIFLRETLIEKFSQVDDKMPDA